MTTFYKIVSNGEDISYSYSKRGCVLAEYTDNPAYYRTRERAEESLKELKESVWDYQFSVLKYIREGRINKDNLEIVEVEFEDD